MSLASGTRLGPYEIQSPIGAGGMGEVYKARDTRLERTVAIKVLPPGFATDRDRRVRFEREAKTVAALNHPHICALYDVGERAAAGGEQTTLYLVMEHLQGETLAARLQKGPLTLEQALTVAAEIADALAAAHKQGIVHRDLKPGNVMLTKSGAKLLDFGLAKLMAPVAAAISMSTLPTQGPATAAGVVLGTIPYMAPEQLEGKDADARSDIFSFGVVLYEMLTGKRAFEGESHASVIAAILDRDPPPPSSVQPLAPAVLDRLVRKCLAKDPDRRWQSASDVADELRWLAGGSGSAGTVTPTGTARWTWRGWSGAAGVIVGALLIGGLGGAALRWAIAPPLHQPVQRVSIPLADHGVTSVIEVAISPDGSTIAFTGTDEKGKRLYLRRLDTDGVRPLEGTENALNPCFSPDGKSLGFRTLEGAVATLRRIPVSGGPPIVISTFPAMDQGLSWEADDSILFVSDAGVSRIPSAAGSKAQVLMPLDGNRVRATLPRMLPGGELVLLTTVRDGKREVSIWSLRTRTLKRLFDGDNATYVPATGHLLWRQAGGDLLAASFDADTLTAGVPAVVAPSTGTSTLLSAYAVSSTGMLVQVPGSRRAGLAWTDRSGRVTPLPFTFPTGQVNWLALSPDGRRAVLSFTKPNQLHVANLDGDAPLTPLTQGGKDQFCLFTPDGSRVLFTRGTPETGFHIFSTRADGTGMPVQETYGANWEKATSVGPTPAGDVLLFNDVVPKGEMHIRQQRLGRRSSAAILVKAGQRDVEATFSPNGRWIAYESDASGTDEIYVKGYPDGPLSRLSTNGGHCPVWNPNGAEVFFFSGPSVFSVPVRDGAPAGPPTQVVERVPRDLPMLDRTVRNWDTVDGRRFLVEFAVRPVQLQIVNNWFEELKAKVRDGR